MKTRHESARSRCWRSAGVRMGGLLAGALCLVAARSAHSIELGALQNLITLKATIYSGFTTTHANDVATGDAQPIQYVSTGERLPTLWLHYRVPAAQLAALATAAALPDGLSLTPVSVAAGEAPFYYITLAFTEVGGDRQGLRAEWITYVKTVQDPRPRMFLLEVDTSSPTIDPVNLATDSADALTYTMANETVDVRVEDDGASFSASFQRPAAPLVRRVDPEWSTAADIVYWRNGVTDRVYYNGLVTNRDLVDIDPTSVAIDDQSAWAAFTTQLQWVLMLEGRLDTVVLPWTNVADLALDLDPAFRATLESAKASTFSALELQRAQGIGAGLADPLFEFRVQEAPPSIFLVFEMKPDQRQALADAIPLPDGFELASMTTVLGSIPRDIVVLNIYEVQGLVSGFRAEWSVFVTKGDDPTPYYMVIEAQSSVLSLDSVNLFTPPADRFDYSSAAGMISVDLAADGRTFQATIPLPLAPVRAAASPAWTEANDRIYWGNGVYDRIYYNGLQANSDLVTIPAEDVSVVDGSRWASYLNLREVLVFENRLEYVASPWFNLEALHDEITTGIAARKLVVVDKLAGAGRAKMVYVATDAGIGKGPGTDVNDISATFRVAYDAAAGGFSIPSGAFAAVEGWKLNGQSVAKYSNKAAPSGSTGVKLALVKPGKLLKVVSKSLGDGGGLDVLTEGAPSGVVSTAFCVTNDGDSTCYCTAFTKCVHTLIGGDAGARLVCRDGAPDSTCAAIAGP